MRLTEQPRDSARCRCKSVLLVATGHTLAASLSLVGHGYDSLALEGNLGVARLVEDCR